MSDPKSPDIYLYGPELFNKVYEKVKKYMDISSLTSTEILNLNIKIIKIVQKECRDSGPCKKQLVIDILTKIVKEFEYENEEDRETALSFIDNFLPSIIDISIELSKGTISLGKKCKKLKLFNCLKQT
jgi:hypothetical protein